MPRSSIMPAYPAAPSPSGRAFRHAEIAVIGEGLVVPVGSPARALHNRLVETFVAPPVPADHPSLSARMKLAILLGSCTALWLAIGIAVATFA